MKKKITGKSLECFEAASVLQVFSFSQFKLTLLQKHIVEDKLMKMITFNAGNAKKKSCSILLVRGKGCGGKKKHSFNT